MTVEDTANGFLQSYRNPQGSAFLPIQDTQAFATCSVSPATEPSKSSVAVGAGYSGGGPWVSRTPGDPARGDSEAAMDYLREKRKAIAASLDSTAACTPQANALCLSGGRFRVSTAWRAADGRSGVGNAVMLTPDTGYFWFFDPQNVEMIVKVLNACGVNQRIWTFAEVSPTSRSR